MTTSLVSHPASEITFKKLFEHKTFLSVSFFFFFFQDDVSGFFLSYLFIFGCVGSSFLCEGFSLVVASKGHSKSRCAGLTVAASLVVGHRLQTRRLSSCGSGPSCSTVCGIFPDQGSNPCPLHWRADSQPLRHQGSPSVSFLLAEPLDQNEVNKFLLSPTLCQTLSQALEKPELNRAQSRPIQSLTLRS